jgi:hypothetical protein
MARGAALLSAGLLASSATMAPEAMAQGAKTSSITAADIAQLKPGQYIWAPQLAPKGPMVMVVGLKRQQAYVYRNGVRIGVSTISSGKKGDETPTGVFTILQKNKDHRSNLYNDAPMPYMQRLTWDGIALHAGHLPGKPASHGCVRLPMAFAKALFAETAKGMTVVITDDAPDPSRLDGGDLLAPVVAGGTPTASTAPGQRLRPDEAYRWTPEAAPAGPVTLIVSAKDQRMLVLRNGKVIARGRVSIPPGRVRGTYALAFTGFDDRGHSQWIYIDVPGQEERKGQAFQPIRGADLQLDLGFLGKVRSVLTPGATLVATDGGILQGGAGQPVNLLESQPS